MEHVSALDPLDVGLRIDELKLLKAGWLDGKGLSPDHAGLDWLAAQLDRRYPHDLPPPYLYPTPEGGVRAEWSLPPHELSADIHFQSRTAQWHQLNLEDDSDGHRQLSLDSDADWGWLASQVRRASEAGT